MHKEIKWCNTSRGTVRSNVPYFEAVVVRPLSIFITNSNTKGNIPLILSFTAAVDAAAGGGGGGGGDTLVTSSETL